MYSQSDVREGESYSSVTVTVPIVLDAATTDVLTLLSDDAARSILCAADEPLTAKELAEECGVPLSTVYRKLEPLVDTSLMEETTRVKVYGKHPQQYRRRFETLRVHVPYRRSAGVNLSLMPRSHERR